MRALAQEEAAARHPPVAGCTGKQPYATFEAAQVGIRPNMGGRVHAYRCPHCQQWHLGQKKKASNHRYLRREYR